MGPYDAAIPNIGFFLGSTEDTFENLLVQGAWEAAKDAGARLVLVNAGVIQHAPRQESLRNILYTLADRTSLDALILPASVCHQLGLEELTIFCARFAPVPVVSLLYEIPGTHGVISGNRGGMEALMDHLLDVHGLTKLAFIGGPEDQQEAVVRRQVYEESLRARGIGLRADWMAVGDFSRPSGHRAVDTLLADGALPFEGIVAASDEMALGAIDALRLRGYQVPRDLVVTGFDDIEVARFVEPSLTTVRQSAQRQAREAVRVALKLLRGQDAPLVSDIPVEFVVRSSCGCEAWSPHRAGLREPSRILEEGAFWRSRLADAFELALVSGNEPLFFAELELLLEEGPTGALDTFWQTALSQVREEVVARFWSAEQARRGEDLIHTARRVVSENSLRREALARILAIVQSGKVIACGEALVTSYDLGTIRNILGSTLPAMGFTGVWMSLFEDQTQPQGRAVPVVALDFGGVPGGMDRPKPFPAPEFVPGGLRALDRRHRLLVVEALHSRQEHLGLIVFSAGIEAVRVTGSLRNQISGSLQGIQLLEERQRAEHQLLQTEKLAALGNLVAGVAHEINTPLGVAVGAATYLRSLSLDFQRVYEGGQVRKSDLETYITGALDATDLVVSNLNRAADLVTHFKQVATDQASENRRTFAFREYLEETLVSLRPQWKKRPIVIDVRGPANLAFDSYPGAVAQVVTNLLMNALVHAFDQGSPGTVVLDLEDRGDWLLFRFADDGKGIDPEHLPRIFEPFFTTKRGQGGTGLGLQIVHNLVTQVLGGTIACASTPGQGTTFEMILPKTAPGSGSLPQ
jgi:signal transduction histidine kinase/DNA-binding LacI/PurR family transcriptional regulator